MGQLAPDWWMRGVTRSGRRNAPFRGLSRNASKGGGAKNGAERRGGAPRYKRGGSARRVRSLSRALDPNEPWTFWTNDGVVGVGLRRGPSPRWSTRAGTYRYISVGTIS